MKKNLTRMSQILFHKHQLSGHITNPDSEQGSNLH